MKTIFNFITAMVIAVMVGGMLSVGLDINPVLAIGGTVATSVALSFVPKQSAILSVVWLKEAYLTGLVKTLTKAINGSWLGALTDFSSLVENDKIKWDKLGTPPGTTVGPVVTPLTSTGRIDGRDEISLQEIRTDVTHITYTELHALRYDKKNSVKAQHKESLIERFFKNTLHTMSPTSDTAETPVVETTGEDDGTGRKRIKAIDIINLRTKLNKLGVGKCLLILTADHVGDLMIEDMSFLTQYNNRKDGSVIRQYNFDIYENVGYNPVYDNSTLIKKAEEAASSSEDRGASVIILKGKGFKAIGKLHPFVGEPTPKEETWTFKLLAYFVSGHLDNFKGNAAIIDGRV